MKNLLILIVAIALYLHFYPNSEITNFYNEKKEFLLDKFSTMSDTKVRLRSEKIYTDLQPQLGTFSDEEVEHLKEITSSRKKVKEFYFAICQTEQRDVIFHINNESKVCGTIARYTSMF
jgi:hypothetical protein